MRRVQFDVMPEKIWHRLNALRRFESVSVKPNYGLTTTFLVKSSFN